jgi:hypothetical protein
VKVLTVWQPWASLIAIGAKPFEFRGGRPPRSCVGRRIAIHAGKRALVIDELADLVVRLRSGDAWTTCLKPDLALPLLVRAMRAPDLLPRGAILCTAVLGPARDGWDIARAFGGPVNDSDRDQKANFGWPLGDIELVLPPVEHRGRQGWSEWSGR